MKAKQTHHRGVNPRATEKSASTQRYTGRPLQTKSQRAKKISRMVAKISLHTARGDKRATERVMYDSFMDLGGIYVKFLQLIVLNTQFFSHLTPAERMAVYDDVAPDQVDIKLLLNRQLGPRFAEHIVHVDPQPFAGGSFGQVYFATHASGAPIIVKILRPNLVRHIRGDLRVLGVIINLIKSRINVATDINSFFRDFKALVLRETDYITEAKNGQYFYEYFAGNQNIVIPKTYLQLCTRFVIVQDYIHGLPLSELITATGAGHDPVAYNFEKTGSDLRIQMDTLGHELLKSIFVADRVFGDPHPGNIKLMTENRVGIMDFGIAGQPLDDRRAFMILMEDIVGICEGTFDPGVTFINGMRYFTPDLYRSINTLSSVYRKDNEDETDILREIRRTAELALYTSSKQVDLEQLIRTGRVSKIMNTVINDGNKFSLHVVMDQGTIVAIRTADGYIRLLEALGLVEQLIPRVIKSAIQETHADKTVLKGRSETMDIEMAVNILSDWAQNLIESDPIFFAPLVKKVRMVMRPSRPNPISDVSGPSQVITEGETPNA